MQSASPVTDARSYGRVSVLARTADPLIIASDLTLIECDRVLHRTVVLGELSEADAADRRAQLATVSADWTLLRIGAEAVERARQPFPGAPLRTLDAIHWRHCSWLAPRLQA